MTDIWGPLTRQELLNTLPTGMLPHTLRTWAQLRPAVQQLPQMMQDVIREAARAKEEATANRKRKAKENRQDRWRRKLVSNAETSAASECDGQCKQATHQPSEEYMQVPTDDQRQRCIAAFIDATNNDAIASAVCVICAWELQRKEGDVVLIKDILNVRRHLTPADAHVAHRLWDGLLIEGTLIDRLPKYALNNNLWIGDVPLALGMLNFVETLLVARHYPRCYVFKLYPRDSARSQNLRHLQRAMAGNVTLYEINMSAVVDMLEGRLMPQTVETLSSVLAITFVGTKYLPTDWLSRTFRVRRAVVFDALQWLQDNNENYWDITISPERMQSLPVDGIPEEIEAMVRYEDSEDTAVWESEGYMMNEFAVDDGKTSNQNQKLTTNDHICAPAEIDAANDIPMVADQSDDRAPCNEVDADLASDDRGDVIPLHVLGVADIEQTKVSPSELMAQALANISDNTHEGGYVVRHGHMPINDFAPTANSGVMHNPLGAAFLVLFPYGRGTIEAERPVKISLREHCKWALQYHDRWFVTHHSFPFVLFALMQKQETMRSARLQMRRKDFEHDTLALSSITVADLKKAAVEEARHEPISNGQVRALRRHVTAANGHVLGSDNTCANYRSMIWGTCLVLGGPSLWLTINPVDIHDPIAQIFAGEEIDLDNFDAQLGPNSN
ncbi:hypothetical protein M404DRAFT_35377 [Pisolithus tinctorius Marx 270]|uniref:Uncharacterized protein n=1 Tax=Pisolithus tinctorius Marx 270 TaxID=870435 RepID=A0A0C3MYZ8_PISTI|nr:hypothetical protein M404DRAFT_35377 [Pisolithus tinctorius Marx 270]